MSTNTKCNFFLAFLFVDLDINSENIDNDDADPQKIDAQLIKDMLNTLNLQNPSTLGFEDGDHDKAATLGEVTTLSLLLSLILLLSKIVVTFFNS